MRTRPSFRSLRARFATRANAHRARTRRDAWLLFLVTLALYLATFALESDGILLGNDVVPYARELAQGTPQGLWNPHHLLFHPLSGVVTDLWCALSRRPASLARALEGQRFVSALGGACAVVLVFRFVSNLCRRWSALGLTAVFALSAGTWLYSSVGETYLPATAALAGLLAIATEVRLGVRNANPVLIAAWLYLAVLLRQDSVLVVPVLLWFLPWRTWAWSVGGAGLASLGMYGFAWMLSQSGVGFSAWLRGLAESGLWGGALAPRDLLVSLGLTLASLAYGTFYWATWYKLALGLLAVALLVAVALPPRRLNDSARPIAFGLCAFALLRLVFFAWWQPGNMEYHAGSVLPLVFLVALFWNPSLDGRRRRVRDLALAACVALVGIGNCAWLIAPNRGDEIARRSGEAIALAGTGGLVIALDRLQHYALLREERADVEALDASDLASGLSSAGLAELRARIDETLARESSVVVVRDVLLPERFQLDEWPLAADNLAALIEGRRSSVERVDDDQRAWAWRLR